MSGKRNKKLRKEIKRFNKKVFYDFTVEVSAMPFWPRLKFCMLMAFCRHKLQKSLMEEIKAKRAEIKQQKKENG